VSFRKSILLGFIVFISLNIEVNAGDFGWLEQLSIEAKSDGSGFRTRLATRFKIGEVKVKAVISDTGNGADAYMVMRLGEMSGHNVEYVAKRYKANKGKGWGALARSLGIKPGSRAFKALKRGHDLNDANQGSRGKEKKKSHKNKGKGNKP
jgi:hypothetical protein